MVEKELLSTSEPAAQGEDLREVTSTPTSQWCCSWSTPLPQRDQHLLCAAIIFGFAFPLVPMLH